MKGAAKMNLQIEVCSQESDNQTEKKKKQIDARRPRKDRISSQKKHKESVLSKKKSQNSR